MPSVHTFRVNKNMQKLQQSLHSMGGIVLTVLFLTSLGITLLVPAPKAYAALNDEYDGKNAVACGSYEWCINGNPKSSRLYYYRNCTDWAAWRIPKITQQTVPSTLGHGGFWDDNKPAYAEKDTVPEVGDAAVFNPSSSYPEYGHVAVVEKVNSNGTVMISQYNGRTGAYSVVTIAKTEANWYIDFTPDVNEGADVGSGSTSSDKRSDFNGSGRSDALLYAPGAANDNIMYGRATQGNFGYYDLQLNGTYKMAVGNFNGDEEDDFFAYGGGVGQKDFVFYGQPDAGVFNKYELTIDGDYDQVVPGDFDGDGIDDVVLFANNGTDKVIYGTRKAATFSAKTMNRQIDGDYQITSGKYNEDNRSDIFLYSPTSTDYTLPGRTTRGEFGVYDLNRQITGIYEHPVSGDFNGDGRDDVLLYGLGTSPDHVFVGRAKAGEFGNYNTSIDRVYRPIATGDYDGDGFEDVIMHGPGPDAVDRVLYGTGQPGTFDAAGIDLKGDYQRIST